MHFLSGTWVSNDGGNLIKAPITDFVKSCVTFFFSFANTIQYYIIQLLVLLDFLCSSLKLDWIPNYEKISLPLKICGRSSLSLTSFQSYKDFS